MKRARTVQAPDLGGCLQRLRVAAGGPAAETAAKTIAKLLEKPRLRSYGGAAPEKCEDLVVIFKATNC